VAVPACRGVRSVCVCVGTCARTSHCVSVCVLCVRPDRDAPRGPRFFQPPPGARASNLLWPLIQHPRLRHRLLHWRGGGGVLAEGSGILGAGPGRPRCPGVCMLWSCPISRGASECVVACGFFLGGKGGCVQPVRWRGGYMRPRPPPPFRLRRPLSSPLAPLVLPVTPPPPPSQPRRTPNCATRSAFYLFQVRERGGVDVAPGTCGVLLRLTSWIRGLFAWSASAYAVSAVHPAGMGIVFDPYMPIDRLHVPLSSDRSTFVINCPWSPPKVNAGHLAVLARLVDRLHECVVFVYSPGLCGVTVVWVGRDGRPGCPPPPPSPPPLLPTTAAACPHGTQSHPSFPHSPPGIIKA
jgi:hypothetical protein